jgi:hypothetical protein
MLSPLQSQRREDDASHPAAPLRRIAPELGSFARARRGGGGRSKCVSTLARSCDDGSVDARKSDLSEVVILVRLDAPENLGVHVKRRAHGQARLGREHRNPLLRLSSRASDQ